MGILLTGVFGLVLCACASGAASEPRQEDLGDEAALERAANDSSWELFLGKWVSVHANVPDVGSVPNEAMIRSLEFLSERADTPRYARRRMIEVVRPDCDDCRDNRHERATYRSVASSEDLRAGKIYTTEGGNTTSSADYEISEDQKTLTLKSRMGDGSRVTREFRRVEE